MYLVDLREKLSNKDKDLNAREAWMLLTLAFLLFCAVRFLLSDFPKAAFVYPDELRYWDIPRGLYQGQGITLQGIPYNHQKIGYCLLYVPFFAISNVALRLRLISLMNVILLCSSCFWVFLIAREWELNYKRSLLLGVLCLLWPNQLYSMTLMSENFYVPVFLVGFWLYIRNDRHPRVWRAAVCGVFCYLNYFIKERGIVLPLALAGIEIGFPIMQFLCNLRKGQRHPIYQKKKIVNMLVMLTSFFVISFVVKKLVFQNLPNEWWSGVSAAVIFEPKYFVYGCYCVLYYLVVVTIAVFCVPVFAPIVIYDDMEESHQKNYLLLMMMNVLMAGMISFRIAMYEDYGKLQPRMHLRYYGPQIFLTLGLFLAVLYCYQGRFAERKIQKKYLVLGSLCLGIVLLVFKGMYRGSCVDHYDLHWTISNPFYEYPFDTKYAIQAIYSVGVVMGILVYGGYYCFRRDMIKRWFGVFLGTVIVLCIVNQISGYDEVKGQYLVDPKEIDDITVVASLKQNNPEASFLVMSSYQDLKVFNTYCDSTPDMMLGTETDFWKQIDRTNPEFVCNSYDVELPSFVMNSRVIKPQKIDYYAIGGSGDERGVWTYSNVEMVYEGEHYCIYRNLDPKVIYVKRGHD
ncbi:MAG: hypothetical protein K5891_08275 [Lachnospiraceae bacterium]|nr:hypothetical protein [Lachnospiraceae bacterium]